MVGSGPALGQPFGQRFATTSGTAAPIASLPVAARAPVPDVRVRREVRPPRGSSTSVWWSRRGPARRYGAPPRPPWTAAAHLLSPAPAPATAAYAVCPPPAGGRGPAVAP